MIIQIWNKDEKSGLLDSDARRGDAWRAFTDDFAPNFGTLTPKAWLMIKVPDPPLVDEMIEQLQRSEYTLGATPQEAHVTRRKRIFALDYWNYFTSAELAIIDDQANQLPEGQLDSGGTVVDGIVEGKFTVTDIRRK